MHIMIHMIILMLDREKQIETGTVISTLRCFTGTLENLPMVTLKEERNDG